MLNKALKINNLCDILSLLSTPWQSNTKSLFPLLSVIGQFHNQIPSVFTSVLNPASFSIKLFAKIVLPTSQGPLTLIIHNFAFFNAVNILIASVVVSKIPFFESTN